MQWDKESTGTCPADQIRLFKIWGGKETGSLPPLWPPSSAEFRGSAYPNYKLDLFSHYLLQWWWMHCVWYLAMQQEKHVLSVQNTTVGGTSTSVRGILWHWLLTSDLFYEQTSKKKNHWWDVLMFHFKVSVDTNYRNIFPLNSSQGWQDGRKEKQNIILLHIRTMHFMLFLSSTTRYFSGLWKLFKWNNLRSISYSLIDWLTCATCDK